MTPYARGERAVSWALIALTIVFMALVTRDAHELYRRFGFTALPAPERYMEKVDPDVYTGRLRRDG